MAQPGDADDELADLTPASWLRFGQRNILYLGFVALLLPFGLALEGPRTEGAQSPGGLTFAMALSLAVSLGFFAINAGCAVAGIARRRNTEKALIGCLLPLGFFLCAMTVWHLTR